MNGFITNIGKTLMENTDFRRVLYTTKRSQLVVMTLKPGEEIGEETHTLDQFINIAVGSGKAVLNGNETEIGIASVIVVPAGTRHNIINTSQIEPMKLYTLYCPPDHKDGLVHKTKEDAEKNDIPFDGKTTE
jgi:mannose-6-phosphate isomerase-like protein (cupin superfamily)